MICQNCGAKFAKNSIRCPYCHSENVQVAERQKREILAGYDKEAAAMAKSVPQKAVRRWTFYLFCAMGILLAVGIVAAIAAVVVSRLSAGMAYDQEQRHQRKLEAFCEQGEYQALSDYLREEELYGGAYEKYWQVKTVYQSYTNLQDDMKSIREVLAEDSLSDEEKEALCGYWIESVLENGAVVLTESRSAIEDRAILGNEALLEGWYEEGRLLLEEAGLSQEEIDSLEREEADMTALYEKLWSAFQTEE